MLIAGLVSAVIVSIGLAVLSRTSLPLPLSSLTRRDGQRTVPGETVVGVQTITMPPLKTEAPRDDPAPERREKLPEEVLAEAGEDRGAVYAMNRIREAIREGNPAFARQLLGRMKVEHCESVLLKAAEDLIQAGE